MPSLPQYPDIVMWYNMVFVACRASLPTLPNPLVPRRTRLKSSSASKNSPWPCSKRPQMESACTAWKILEHPQATAAAQQSHNSWLQTEIYNKYQQNSTINITLDLQISMKYLGHSRSKAEVPRSRMKPSACWVRPNFRASRAPLRSIFFACDVKWCELSGVVSNSESEPGRGQQRSAEIRASEVDVVFVARAKRVHGTEAPEAEVGQAGPSNRQATSWLNDSIYLGISNMTWIDIDTVHVVHFRKYMKDHERVNWRKEAADISALAVLVCSGMFWWPDCCPLLGCFSPSCSSQLASKSRSKGSALAELVLKCFGFGSLRQSTGSVRTLYLNCI